MPEGSESHLDCEILSYQPDISGRPDRNESGRLQRVEIDIFDDGARNDAGADPAFDEIAVEPGRVAGRPTTDIDSPFDMKVLGRAQAMAGASAQGIGAGEQLAFEEIRVMDGGQAIGLEAVGWKNGHVTVGSVAQPPSVAERKFDGKLGVLQGPGQS